MAVTASTSKDGARPPRPRLLLGGALVALALVCAGLVGLLGSLGPRGAGGRARDRAGPDNTPAAREPAALVPPDSPAPAARPLDAARADRAEVERAADEPAAERDPFDPAAVTGVVLWEGRPVEGVELRLHAGDLQRRERAAPVATTASDADGRFRFPGREPHARHTLRFQHPDFLPGEASVWPGRDEELELERAARVAGTVRSARTRAPLAGVEVALERWHEGPAGPSARVVSVTDAEGRWQLPWAEPGIERFLVTRPGHAPDRHEFQVGPDGGTEFDILVDERPALELELYVHETGETLADAEVEWDDAPVRTDARGRLAVPLAPRASEDDAVRVSLALPGGAETQGRIAPSAVRGFLRVPLVRGGAVHGRVLDAGGNPVEGALVRLGGGRSSSALELPEGLWVVPPRATVRSGADGAFRLAGLPPRTTPTELRATHPLHPPGRSEPFELARLGAEARVDVVLEPGATIEGVLSLDGVPAPLEISWEGERAGGRARANDRGAYRIMGVPAGEVDLRPRAHDEDEDTPRAEDARLTVAAGETLVLDFDLASRKARIRGRVLDARGEPIAGAEVSAAPSEELEEGSGWGDEEPYAESRRDGTFELLVPDVPGLLLDVRAELGPRSAIAAEVRAGAEVELVLPVLTPVALRVVDAVERDPVLGFQVYWRDSREGSFARLSQGGSRFSPGPDGLFRAELPLGELDLAVSARSAGLVTAVRRGIDLSGRGVPEIVIELDRGVELELDVELAPEAADFRRTLQRGRVSIASDEQWAGRSRGGALFQQDVRNGQAVRTDDAGIARLGALAPGTYRLANVPRGYRIEPERFEVPPVAHHRVKLKVDVQPQRGKPGGGRD